MDIIIEGIIRLILATGLSGLIGIERQESHKPAGLRTHVLVCIGATLVTLVGITYTTTDTARIIQGVITGIGFLGAGSIIAGRHGVHGLTTAATIWVSAILGVTVGAGLYEFAIVTTALVSIILRIKPIEKKL